MPRLNLALLAESVRVRRFRWPLIVLLASIGLTAFAAVEAQRTVRSQRQLAERALRDYASFAAWSYAQHLMLSLNGIEREAIGAVNHGDNMHSNRTVPLARDLAHYLPWDERCQCHRSYAGPNPDAFFAINLRAHELNVGVNTHVNADEGWEVDRPMSGAMHMEMMSSDAAPEDTRTYNPAERAWLLDSLTRIVRTRPGVSHGFTFVVDNSSPTARIFAYTLMPTSWGDTMVYGARYSRAAFARIVSGVLDENGLLPAAFTEGRRNRDILALTVRDNKGNSIFASDSALSPTAHIELPDRVGSLIIDAAIRPELAGALLIGGLPASRLPFLFGLLGLAAALSIVAVMQLRREGELAHLQAGFVSSVSHELRTPLAQIRLYLETLQLGRASTDEQRSWSLGHIDRETKRLSHLVENVLRFSTLGAHDPTEHQPVDVGDEIEHIAQEFGSLAASRRTTIVVDAAPTAPIALSPDALRHIVLNLLDNAVKYGPTGQTVRVSVRGNDDGGVNIAVEDEGPGVATADRDRIWQPFMRGSKTVANGGSGIGLTIVREVAVAHGGTARVESSPSGGARFIVTLR